MNGPIIPPPPHGWPSDALVHAVHAIGHRHSYVDTMARMLHYQPLIAPLDGATARRLLQTDRLVLATFDDAPAIYAVIALLRGLSGRRTAALYLRPQTCMRTDHMKYRLKKVFYRALRSLPGLTLITITPHGWSPELGQVSHAGTYDPQYWDFHDGTALRPPPHSELSRELARIAGARRIVCLPGFLSREKGLEFFTRITATRTMTHVPVLMVAAGEVLPGMEATAEAFKRAGGKLVDRELSDEEIESLYGICAAVWACYIPQYDQASGIFGRAFQTGTPVLVRQGSLIEAAAQDLGATALALPFDDAEGAAAVIAAWVENASATDHALPHPEGLSARVRTLKEHFLNTIRSALAD